MRRGNRPQKEITTERETTAWSLRQRGYTQEQIAEQIGINHGNVSRLLNKLNDRYLRSNLDKVERVKVEQTRILWWMAAEALRAWEESKKPLERTRAMAKGEQETGVVETTGREGNVSYLHTARSCMADIRSIWGADVAPAQQDAALGIAQLIKDLESRGKQYDSSGAAGSEEGAKIGETDGSGGIRADDSEGRARPEALD